MGSDNHFSLAAVPPVDLEIHLCNIERNDPRNVHTQHAHDKCEIYLNLTGDVVFMVEDTIYPVKSGDVIITRPYESHHCIYQGDTRHRHVCLWFSAVGDEPFLSLFFQREAGKRNRLVFAPEHVGELVEITSALAHANGGGCESYILFFRLLSLLAQGQAKKPEEECLPKAVKTTMELLATHPGYAPTIKQLAALSHMSVSCFERQFTAVIGQSPCRYLKERRLLSAASLLAGGCTVTEAAEKSGFSDYSGFIAAFRKYFGVTPLRYRRKTYEKIQKHE